MQIVEAPVTGPLSLGVVARGAVSVNAVVSVAPAEAQINAKLSSSMVWAAECTVCSELHMIRCVTSRLLSRMQAELFR